MAEPGAPEHPEADAVERGDIFFFYRPKVGEEHPHGLDDVGRFHLVLRKRGGRLFRLLTIGRKRLPDVAGHEREWGFVDLVADEPKAIADALKAETYQTKTRGLRTRPAARPAGEGGYALVRGARSLFLAYRLELPEEPGPVQEELNIASAASFVISVKNPDTPNPPGIGLREQDEAAYPKSLRKAFHGRRFAGEDPHLLDFEGAEFILIGASEDPLDELGVEPGHPGGAPDAAAVLRRLRIPKREAPIEPLVEGAWA
ncbi:MAG: hypothetical protein M3M95_03185 [Pseudomonadota bacterium]|nr:hypothetical protein [Pseudomonadota bacterium]